MAKKHLHTRPDWSIPSDEDLARSVPGKAVSHFENYHDGLEKIECEAIYMNDAGAKVPQGSFQTFELPDGGRGRVPALNPLVLAQIVWTRCDAYAVRKKRKCTFIVFLFGTDAKSKPWKHRLQFTIDGTPDDLEEDEEEEDDDEDEPEQASAERVREPRGGPDEDVYREDAAHGSDMRDTYVHARPLPLGPSSFVPSSEVDVMPPALINTPHNGAMELARSPAGQETVLASSIHRAYAGAMAEHRALVQQVRVGQVTSNRDMKAMFESAMESNRETTKEVIEFFKERMIAAEKRAENAEQRIIDMSRLEGAQRESLLEVSQQGWVAFIEGMKMKAESISVQQEYDRAFLGMQLQNLQSGNRKSAAGGALKSLLPFAATGLSAILRARGDDQSANTIDQLSKMVTRATIGASQGEVEEDEIEDEGPLPPIVVAVRSLRESMLPDQVKALRAAMPKQAWQLFEGAANSELEAACFACLSSMNQFMISDPTIQMRVIEALEPEQQTAMMAIVAAVQGGAPTAQKPPSQPQSQPSRPPFGTRAAAPPQPTPASQPRRMPPRPGPSTPPPT